MFWLKGLHLFPFFFLFFFFILYITDDTGLSITLITDCNYRSSKSDIHTVTSSKSKLHFASVCFFLSVVSGFNVGRSAGGRSTVREINRDACHFPGFPVLQTLLPKHTNVPELYFLLMALFLQQPVTELPESLQVHVSMTFFPTNRTNRVSLCVLITVAMRSLSVRTGTVPK